MYEYLLILTHLGYGYLLGYTYILLRYKKISFIKDILFCIISLSFYIKLIDSYIITTNLYLILFIFIGSIIGYKYYNKKTIKSFYTILKYFKILLSKISFPPIFKYFINKIKHKVYLKNYYKTHPYLKKSIYDLF